MEYTGIELGSSSMNRTTLVSKLDEMVVAYNEHPDVDSYSAEPAAKKLRSRKGKATPQADPDEGQGYDKGLRIGVRRLTAMKNLLSTGTLVGYNLLRVHLLWVSDYRYSVISDEILMKKWFFVGSTLPKEEATLPALDSGLKPEAVVPRGSPHAPMQHDTPLSGSQFHIMLNKAIRIYEDQTLHLERDEAKTKFKPTEEKWLQYRKISQRWDETVSDVARLTLCPADFEVLERVVLQNRSLDDKILRMLERKPPIFHLGMLPSLSTGNMQTDEVAKELQAAQTEAASAKLRLFEAELKADWSLITEVQSGCAQLHELLRWLELEHRRGQATIGQALVDRRMAKQFPLVAVDSWDKLSGQLSLHTTAWDRERPGGVRRAIVWVDFNTPHSRDVLRLPALIESMASLAKNTGPANTLIFAWMPNVPKEGSDRTPDDDEADIAGAFRKAGFQTQVRIRMVFQVHTTVAQKTSELDWWADGRLLSLSAPQENWWLKHSELARIRRVLQEPTLPLSKDLVTITSLDENTDINASESPPDLAAKCAQRGPALAETQLAALLSKCPLQPEDETLIIDVLPHVGDRALGTHQFLKSPAAENRGKQRRRSTTHIATYRVCAKCMGVIATYCKLSKQISVVHAQVPARAH